MKSYNLTLAESDIGISCQKENEHIYDHSCNNLQKNNSPAVMSGVSCFRLLEGGATLSSPGAQTARTMTGAGSLHE